MVIYKSFDKLASRNSLHADQPTRREPNLKQFNITRFLKNPSLALNTDSAAKIAIKFEETEVHEAS